MLVFWLRSGHRFVKSLMCLAFMFGSLHESLCTPGSLAQNLLRVLQRRQFADLFQSWVFPKLMPGHPDVIVVATQPDYCHEQAV